MTQHTVHSPRTATCSVTCLHDRRQTYHVSFQRRATRTSRTAATQRHAAVVCQSCCIDVDDEEATTMTSRADVVTSLTARRMCALLTQSTATLRTSDRQLILATESQSSRRRTVDDHRGRRRCPVDVSFRRR